MSTIQSAAPVTLSEFSESLAGKMASSHFTNQEIHSRGIRTKWGPEEWWQFWHRSALGASVASTDSSSHRVPVASQEARVSLTHQRDRHTDAWHTDASHHIARITGRIDIPTMRLLRINILTDVSGRIDATCFASTYTIWAQQGGTACPPCLTANHFALGRHHDLQAATPACWVVADVSRCVRGQMTHCVA